MAKRAIGQFTGNFSLRLDLNVVADPSKQINSRCAASPRGARGDLGRAGSVDFHSEETRTAGDDLLHLIGAVISRRAVIPKRERSGALTISGPRGCADQRELRQLQSQTPACGP